VGKAFGVAVVHDEKAMALMGEMYARRGMEFNEARKRMARMPVGSVHIDNPVSVAPGFNIGNVYVMAGVPAIFQAMLDSVTPTLKGGAVMLSQTVTSRFGEGTIGGPLGDIQKANPETVIGSYPKYLDGKFWTELVVRSRDAASLAKAKAEIEAMLAKIAANA